MLQAAGHFCFLWLSWHHMSSDLVPAETGDFVGHLVSNYTTTTPQESGYCYPAQIAIFVSQALLTVCINLRELVENPIPDFWGYSHFGKLQATLTCHTHQECEPICG